MNTAALLEPKLSYLELRIAPALHELAGLRVLRNKAEVPRALWGVRIPGESGRARRRGSLPGKKP